jgi:hypothetical protein
MHYHGTMASDPYMNDRADAAKLVAEFAVDDEAALKLVLWHGGYRVARRNLQQRWWRGEVELRG